METQRVNSDIISNLPDHITEYILTFMPIRDALRTSILSTIWRYTWRSMPKLVFRQNMVEVPSLGNLTQLKRAQMKKYKLVSAIFHVLLLHNGPAILDFYCDIRPLHMDSEFDQIISYIARWNTVKELAFGTWNSFYKLPVSFFSLQQLEVIYLQNCTVEAPLTFNGFSRLKEMTIWDVKVSAHMLQRILSKCPLLEQINLIGAEERLDLPIPAGGSKFTCVDLLKCVPLIKVLDVKKDYMKYLCAGDMPNVLPTSLDHLACLYLDVCLMEQNEISFALCMIRSSPVLDSLTIQMYDNEILPVQQTPTNFLDLKDHSDLKLNYLKKLTIQKFSNLPLETEFVKLIMAKSPVLEKVCIDLKNDVSVDEELKILRELVLLPFPRASPSATLAIKRP